MKPKKRNAQIGEIIRIYEANSELFLIVEVSETTITSITGATELEVTHVCVNVHDEDDVRYIFDEDVAYVAYNRYKASEFIENMQNNEAIIDADYDDLPFEDYYPNAVATSEFEKFSENIKKAKISPWQRMQERNEYIDFMLDRYGDLLSLKRVLEEDDERQEEIALILTELADTATIQCGS